MLIFGTGAMGCAFAARLGRAGIPVTLVGTWDAGLAAIAERGIRMEEPEGSWSQNVAVRHRDEALPAGEPGLILVKSTQTAAVAPAAARPGGLILTLQNGLGNRETLAGAAPGRVALGVVTMGATLLGPGHVRDGGPGRIVIGNDPRLAGDLDPLAAALARVFAVERADDIEPIVWRKLAINCAVNGPAALLGIPNGALLDTPERRSLLDRLAREVEAVALARGTPIGDAASAVREVAARTAGNRNSMLQDLDRGGPTEVEAIYGALCREAARVGVPVPENEKVYESLRRREPSGAFA